MSLKDISQLCEMLKEKTEKSEMLKERFRVFFEDPNKNPDLFFEQEQNDCEFATRV